VGTEMSKKRGAHLRQGASLRTITVSDKSCQIIMRADREFVSCLNGFCIERAVTRTSVIIEAVNAFLAKTREAA
jgi:hypothetical protein